MDDDRVSPFIFWRLSKNYFDAAELVGKEYSRHIFLPYYYLLGHSIELSLKAFLVGRGMKASELRKRKYGHNLSALLKESRRRKLGIQVKLSEVDMGVIRLLDFEYAAKKYEYSERGLYRLPDAKLSIQVAHRLLSGLKKYCEQQTLNRWVLCKL